MNEDIKELLIDLYERTENENGKEFLIVAMLTVVLSSTTILAKDEFKSLLIKVNTDLINNITNIFGKDINPIYIKNFLDEHNNIFINGDVDTLNSQKISLH